MRLVENLLHESGNKKLKAEAYEYLSREREKVKHECHLRKNVNQRHLEVKRRLKIFNDVSMYRLARIKSAEEDNNQSNFVCEELKAKLKVTSQPVLTIGKVIQKNGAGKGGSYTWPTWMVQLILEQLVNDMPLSSISPNIASLYLG